MGFTTRQGRRRLPQRQVTQTHILHQFKRMSNLWVGGKVADRVIDFHGEHFARMFFSHAHRERVGVEPRAAARIAGNFDIWQETHFEGSHALTFTNGAASISCVEREATCAPTPDTRLIGISELLAYVIPETNIGGRTGARSLSNRCLIHFQHAVKRLPTCDVLAAFPSRRPTYGECHR